MSKAVVISDLTVRHIPHGPLGKLWNGKGGAWKQCAMLTGRGAYWLTSLPAGKVMLKLTSTGTGASVEVEANGDGFPPEVVYTEGGKLFFQGEEHPWHLHLAYKEPA